MDGIEYQTVAPENVDVQELKEFYERQASVSPKTEEKFRRMVRGSCCFVTVRHDGRLIGMARGVSDGVRGYLAECKLDPAWQGPAAVTRTDGRIEHDTYGIGREMAMRVLEVLRDQDVERIDVTAHGTEEDFCYDLGFRKVRGVVAMQMDPKILAETCSTA
jgi:hypothetical protein